MKNRFKLIGLLLILIFTSCDKDKEIRRLLTSKTSTERCQGAWDAGQSGNEKYIPLLLNNANDPRVSTSLRFDGFSVYTETMFALERISHVKPPHPYKHILTSPDSVNIKFYSELWNRMNEKK